MEKIIEFIKNADWKHLAISAVLLAVAAACSFFLSSCSTSLRVNGTRKVEKSVIHEQQYDYGADLPRTLTVRSTYVSTKTRG